MIRKFLIHITRNRPMKTIEVNGSPYLERYYMGGLLGYQVWLHHFLSSDGEEHLHSHPWSAVSIVLSGWYREVTNAGGMMWWRIRKAFGLPSLITPKRIHRIEAVGKNTWTLMFVGRKRLPTWEFVNDDGSKESVATSARDWWKVAKPRDNANG